VTSGNAYIVYISGNYMLVLYIVFYAYGKLVSHPKGSVMGLFEKGW
jgi:hypothetical protein